jgi:hypothetical protein
VPMLCACVRGVRWTDSMELQSPLGKGALGSVM